MLFPDFVMTSDCSGRCIERIVVAPPLGGTKIEGPDKRRSSAEHLACQFRGMGTKTPGNYSRVQHAKTSHERLFRQVLMRTSRYELT